MLIFYRIDCFFTNLEFGMVFAIPKYNPSGVNKIIEMTKKELQENLLKARKALDLYNIADASAILSNIALDMKARTISDEVKRILENYNYMISFMLTGAKDESRFGLRDDIVEQLRAIADRIERDNIALDSNDIYSETLRYSKISPAGFGDVLEQYVSTASELSLVQLGESETTPLRRKLEDLEIQLFNLVFVSLNDRNLTSKIKDLATTEDGNQDLAMHLVSAMILSLLFYYDNAKINALLDIYFNASSQRLKGRALTGLVLAASRYKNRISRSQKLLNKLSLLHDDLMAYRSFREILMAILKTRDTDRVSQKMNSEVIPELMKMQPDIIKKMREGTSELSANPLDDNPEWEEMLEKSGLGEKLRELNEMQNSGADMMMVTFANLKQFPFFNVASNWFLPFDSSHTELTSDDKEREILERLMELSSSACDSDKFSLGIALGKMPAAQKDMMISQLDAQFAQMKDEIADLKLKSSAPEFDEEITKTVRDFYRFFKLFRKKNGFEDPFASTFKFDDIPVIGEILSDSDIIKVVAEFYFKRGDYREALELFNSLAVSEPEDASLWEKIGFCYQNMKFYNNAVEAYSKAELLHAPGLWLLKKMAYVYGRTGDFKKALEKCEAILDKEPENREILIRAGYSAMKNKEFDRALGYYYHADYISEGSPSLLRSIIWCEFLKGDYDKCLALYEKLPAEEMSSSDFLNLGHIELIKENYRGALDNYTKAIGESMSDFEKSFEEDLPVLVDKGVDRRNAQIIIDRLRLDKLL